MLFFNVNNKYNFIPGCHCVAWFSLVKKNNDKKEIKYLNVCMDKSLHEEFEQFCKDMGMSKTGACENAIRLYMDKMRKAVKTIK